MKLPVTLAERRAAFAKRRADLFDRWFGGTRTSELARREKVSRWRVHQILLAEAKARGLPGRLSDILAAAGKLPPTAVEVARRLGVSVDAMRRALTTLNLSAPRT